MENQILQKEVQTVPEMAQYLQLSESLIRKLIKRKQIPYIQIRRRHLFFLPEIRNWLSEKTEKITPPTQQNKKVGSDTIWDSRK